MACTCLLNELCPRFKLLQCRVAALERQASASASSMPDTVTLSPDMCSELERLQRTLERRLHCLEIAGCDGDCLPYTSAALAIKAYTRYT